MKNKENSPIVLSGPSGAGKTELLEYIEQRNPLFLEATGCTTRQRRENEIGRMHFLTREEFEKLIATNQLIEYTTYNGNYYGVSKTEFNKLDKYHLMFNVGYSSAAIIKELYNDTFMIYLLPPTKEELRRRIGDRGEERYRLGIEETVKHCFKYDYLLLSQTDDLNETYNDFMDIIEEKNSAMQKRLVLAKNRDFVKNFYN